MTDRIREILQKDNEEANGHQSWYEPLGEDYEYYEHLRYSGTKVKEMDRDSHRWWDEYTVVKKFEFGDEVHYIGYRDAHSTSDMSAEETGWEFRPETIQEYKPKKITTVTYKPI